MRERLLFVQERVAPVLSAAIEAAGDGGIPLRPIMSRALHMGDELHSRNTAAALLFLREIAPLLLELADSSSTSARGSPFGVAQPQLAADLRPDVAPPQTTAASAASIRAGDDDSQKTGQRLGANSGSSSSVFSASEISEALEAITADHYFFLRLSMAAAKATADAAHGVSHSRYGAVMPLCCWSHPQSDGSSKVVSRTKLHTCTINWPTCMRACTYVRPHVCMHIRDIHTYL